MFQEFDSSQMCTVNKRIAGGRFILCQTVSYYIIVININFVKNYIDKAHPLKEIIYFVILKAFALKINSLH